MLKTTLLWIFGAFLLLQAIQIDIPEAPKDIDPENEIKAPTEIAAFLKRSCYDCHSYQTKFPWYGHISPISLEVKSHIKEGRAVVNFQDWGTYSEKKRQKIYQGIVKSINYRMPLPMYLSMHEEATLTKDQREMIKKWAKSHIKEQ